MWPALMLAASRTLKVMGRTRILTVSIRMSGGDSHAGAPLGRRLAAAVIGFLMMPEIMRDSHNGRARVTENKRWDEMLRVCGIIPMKLIRMMAEKRGHRMDARLVRLIP